MLTVHVIFHHNISQRYSSGHKEILFEIILYFCCINFTLHNALLQWFPSTSFGNVKKASGDKQIIEYMVAGASNVTIH